jgi:TPR repeat protein
VSPDAPELNAGVERNIMKARIKAWLMALVLVTNFAVPAIAGSLEALQEGATAFAHRDYATALRLLRPLAETGNPQAMTILGEIFYNGQGVQDYAEAARWYRKAAEQGEAHAMANLGLMNDLGRGVPQNYAEAGTWYRKAAEQGEPLAMVGLGEIFYHGLGAPQDYVQAHKWYNLAAANSTTKFRDLAVKDRDLVAGKMTAAQIAEAQSLAREWKPTSASSPKRLP